MKIAKLKINIDRVKAIRILLGLIVLSVFGYVYLVNAITFNIAQKGKIVNQISVINSEIGELELAIIDQKKDISKEMAYEFGLTQEIENKTIFVLRGENTRLTFNE